MEKLRRRLNTSVTRVPPCQCLSKVFASRRLLASLSGRADRYNRGFFIKKFDDSTNHAVFSHHAGENRHPEGAMHLGKMLVPGRTTPDFDPGLPGMTINKNGL